MTRRTRTIFLGSGPFALPSLEVLVADPDLELRAVVSTPPRPAGRSGRPGTTPVAARATALGLPLQRPERLRDAAAVDAIEALAPELIVLADYGQLVPAAVLELPAHGALNLHPSLLPRHRGAAPIQAAILAGDADTGVTLMRMDEGLDSGPLVAQARTPIGAEETAPELEARLAWLAAGLLREQLGPWLRGEVRARPQPANGATMTRPLRREDGHLDPARSAVALARQVRALQPWPNTFMETASGRVVLWAVEVLPAGKLGAGAIPGTLVADAQGLALVTGEGGLRLLDVQPAGGRRMTGAELRRGRPGLVGSRIGAAPLR